MSRQTIQQAVVLAAGKGKRLGELTQRRSKGMLPVLGKPFVGRVMEALASWGIRQFVVVAAPQDEEMVHYLQGEPRREWDVAIAIQPRQLGMGDALRSAAGLINTPFVLAACDNLFSDEDIRRVLGRWQTGPHPNGVLSLLEVEPERVGSVGVVRLQGEWVDRIIEKPSPRQAFTRLASVPLYCFSSGLLDYLPEIPLSPRGEYELQDAIQMLIEREGRVCGVMVSGRMTLTTPEDLLNINLHYLRGMNASMRLPGEMRRYRERFEPPVYMESGARVAPGCKIGPGVYLEAGSRVEAGAALRRSVLLRGAVVPAGAEVVGAIVAGK